MQRALPARNRRRSAKSISYASASAYELLALEQRVMLSGSMIAKPLAVFGQIGDGGLARIGGIVFFDNHEADNPGTGSPGVMTLDDNGIPNVEVDITNTTSGVTQNVVTDANGQYLFSDLAAGTYTVTVVPPTFAGTPAYKVGPLGIGGNAFARNVFSQTAVAGGLPANSVSVTVTNNTDDSNTENCGMYTTTPPPPFIGGLVFNDKDADGLFDNADTGIGNVTVNLLDANGNILFSAQTVAAPVGGGTASTNAPVGSYSFPATLLAPSTMGGGGVPFDAPYRIQFVMPGNFSFTSNKEVNNSPTLYSWANTSTDITDPIVIKSRVGTNPPLSDTAQTDVNCGFFNLTVTVSGPFHPANSPDPDDGNTGILRPLTGTASALFAVTVSPLVPVQEFIPWFTQNGPAQPGGTLLGQTIDSALAGTDYTANGGVLEFDVSPKPVSLLLTVQVLGYVGVVNDRQFTVGVTPPPGFLTVPTPPQVQCIILNTSFPQATIGDFSGVRPTTGTTDFPFDVTLSAPVGLVGTFTGAPFNVFVAYNTEDFSAKQPIDYTTTASGTTGLMFNPNSLTLTGQIQVPVIGGTNPELSRQFHVLVDVPESNTSTIGTPAFGVGTILPNTPPQLSIAGSSVTENLLGLAQLPFTVTIDPALPQTLTFNYATSDGTAIAGLDYAATSGSFTLVAGQVTQTIFVPVFRRFLSAQDKTLNMTISTTDPDINVITPTAVGTIHDLALVALPFSGKKKATYTDYLTDPVSVSLTGPGTGNVVFIGDTSVNTNAFEILVDGGTAATSLTINVRKGKQTSFQNILVSSSIGAIQAKSSNILGLITIAGSLNTLALNYMAGVNLTVGAGTGSLNLNVGQSVGTTITSAIPIGTLTALAYLSNSTTPVNLSAPSIAKINIKGAFGSTTVQTDSIGSVNVAGLMSGVSLLAVDSLGPITAKAIASCTFFAGMASTLTTLPTASTDFANKSASIASIRATNAGGFSNSLIAAWRIGAVNLGKIATNNGGTPFGVSGDQITSVTGIGTSNIHLVNINDLTPPLIQNDFNIRPF
jgi:Carboxypeptidase regulatory-like domain/SdrD B-like domain/Calx-beta domain